MVQIHSPRPLLNLQHKPHTFFHDGPLLPWHRHLLAGLIQPGGVNHVSGTFCIGKVRTLTVDAVGFTGFPHQKSPLISPILDAVGREILPDTQFWTRVRDNNSSRNAVALPVFVLVFRGGNFSDYRHGLGVLVTALSTPPSKCFPCAQPFQRRSC